MPKHYRPPGKKKEGNAAKYMTRTQALKHLQVNLNLFRRLCIIKGVFPREPKKKIKGNHHTYYHVKDIAFLQHEPLLEKFREIKTYRKKVTKAKAKKNEELARLLLTRQPSYKLDRLIRERYPTFVDALRDLDDCLTMVHLFAVLPATDRENLEVKLVHNCRRLSHEWQAYISRTHSLRKVFVSVKGIYYQAEVEGQKITWLTPHALQQVMTNDVDFGVMLTFLEFYETLLAFVNLKLYHSVNVKYPPILDPRLEALAADLYALSRYIDASSKGLAVKPQAIGSSNSESNANEESDLRLSQLQHQLPSNEPGALMHLVVNEEDEDDEEKKACKKLFKGMKFFLSREVPRESLLFVIPSFGGVVSWEGEVAPFKEDNETITHQIVDKASQGHLYLSREYIQPQWIYDCVNARIILPTDNYMVGRIPPPHLSPFVDNEAEGYVPDYAETIKRLQAAARSEVVPLPGVGKDDLEDPQSLLAEGFMSRAEAAEADERKKKMIVLEKQYHDELRMELKGVRTDDEKVDMDDDDNDDREEPRLDDATNQTTDENADMGTVLMSRKKRKLYEAMKISQKRKKAGVERLKERKKKLEN
ncbi:PREDICTED: pescadillo homolog [Tarenaya hassleriana]|uniref:pescadillo homolog n=1 Tax=Tarenaya hassleriana TaxID=28532 RepID=UPI00053C316D|nr:PREDICTED: pescadillo homolog [Tarenaya hassleriana]XP_010551918.1 PREDICTED: pescadillo homolog [Tarenaya hassleriana]